MGEEECLPRATQKGCTRAAQSNPTHLGEIVLCNVTYIFYTVNTSSMGQLFKSPRAASQSPPRGSTMRAIHAVVRLR